MVEVPEVTPVTTPVVNPTVATEVALLVQVPPPGVTYNAVIAPAQTVLSPEIADGSGFTVTGVVV